MKEIGRDKEIIQRPNTKNMTELFYVCAERAGDDRPEEGSQPLRQENQG